VESKAFWFFSSERNSLENLLTKLPLLRRPFYQRDQARRERDALAMHLAAIAPGSLPPQAVPCTPDLREKFRSLAAWTAFVTAHPAVRDPAQSDRIVAHGLDHGVQSAFFGNIPPARIALGGSNHREQFFAAGFNPRQRALFDLLHETVGSRDAQDVAIYAHEGLTPMALALRGRYPRFLGSEYAATEAARGRIYPIPAIDITASGLPDRSFDIVLSGDVLEHVPDLDAALHDTARILRPGGTFLASFPFAFFHEKTTIKARLAAGAIEHFSAPEYHGNPMDTAKGSLVFQIPGWDVLQAARAAGFADAHMLFWSSFARGFTSGAELAGVLMMVAKR
jgi:SAM-dependent methyltransferase